MDDYVMKNMSRFLIKLPEHTWYRVLTILYRYTHSLTHIKGVAWGFGFSELDEC